MGLETTASLSTIAGLNVSWPIHVTDPYSECDDQVVNLKLATTRTFTQISAAMNASSQELNYLSDGRLQLSGSAGFTLSNVLIGADSESFDDVVEGDLVTNVTTTSATAAVNAGGGVITTTGISWTAGDKYLIDNSGGRVQTAVQSLLTQLVTNRQAMSESVNATAQLQSAAMSTRVQIMSNSALVAVQTLSATLNAAKLGINATAVAADTWGNAALYLQSATPASPATNGIWFQM